LQEVQFRDVAFGESPHLYCVEVPASVSAHDKQAAFELTSGFSCQEVIDVAKDRLDGFKSRGRDDIERCMEARIAAEAS